MFKKKNVRSTESSAFIFANQHRKHEFWCKARARTGLPQARYPGPKVEPSLDLKKAHEMFRACKGPLFSQNIKAAKVLKRLARSCSKAKFGKLDNPELDVNYQRKL